MFALKNNKKIARSVVQRYCCKYIEKAVQVKDNNIENNKPTLVIEIEE